MLIGNKSKAEVRLFTISASRLGLIQRIIKMNNEIILIPPVTNI